MVGFVTVQRTYTSSYLKRCRIFKVHLQFSVEGNHPVKSDAPHGVPVEFAFDGQRHQALVNVERHLYPLRHIRNSDTVRCNIGLLHLEVHRGCMPHFCACSIASRHERIRISRLMRAAEHGFDMPRFRSPRYRPLWAPGRSSAAAAAIDAVFTAPEFCVDHCQRAVTKSAYCHRSSAGRGAVGAILCDLLGGGNEML